VPLGGTMENELSGLVVLDVISSLWPIFLGIVTLIFVLSRLWTDVEGLKEKVKTLFNLFNEKK
jgi:hypothetical protein